MEFKGKTPTDSTSGSALITQLLQNDEINLQVNIDTPIVGGIVRGICVYWDKLNERWRPVDGLNPPRNTLVGIVETINGMVGQVRTGGVFQEQTIKSNSAYYAATDGTLTIVPSKFLVGRSTNSGSLVMTVNGSGGSGGSGGSVGDLFWRYYLKDSEIKANGALLARLEYKDLWSFANDMGLVKTEAQWSSGFYGLFSSGDGINTFRIPDFRGVVVRGLDDGRGLDGGRVLGSYQGDAFGAHNHTSGVRTGVNIYGINSTASGAQQGMNTGGESTRSSPYTSTDGGAETRMKNIALYACIQFE